MDPDEALSAATRLIDAHDLTEAEQVLDAILIERDRLAPPALARALLDRGWLYGVRQRYQAALETLAQALVVAENIGLHDTSCEALIELGLALRHCGRFADAEDILARGAQTARTAGIALRLGQCQFLRATVAHQIGAFGQACRLLNEAAEAVDGRPPSPAVDQLLADVARERAASARIGGAYDDAKEELERAAELNQRHGRRVGLANVERELGTLVELPERISVAPSWHTSAPGTAPVRAWSLDGLATWTCWPTPAPGRTVPEPGVD